MFNNFANWFHDGFEDAARNLQQQQQQYQQQQQSKAPPPVSNKFLQSLQYVNVTADDLLEESNKECCICLVTQNLGQRVYKLPCGHLYHPECLLDWIKRHCTCPVCRFELPTDDSNYEQDRKIRMARRKRRYRLDELKRMKVSQLKDISRELQISISDCIDKDEIISKYVNSGKIDITENAPVIEITLDQFNSKGVGELRQLLLSFGISSEGAIEKSELRNRLIDSSRVSIIPDVMEEKMEEDLKPGSKRSNEFEDNHLNNNRARISYSLEKLQHTSIHELKQIATLLNISLHGCCDKADIINNIVNSRKVEISNSKPNENNNNNNNNNNSKSNSSSNNNNNSSSQNNEIFTLSRELLLSMSIREIKDIMNNLNIATSDCTEKNDMIDKLRKPQYFNIIRIID